MINSWKLYDKITAVIEKKRKKKNYRIKKELYILARQEPI